MEITTLRKLISFIRSDISPFYPDGEVEAILFILLQHTLNLNRTGIYLNQDSNVPKSVVQSIEEITKRLKKFEPLQYIIGETEFYNCRLKVGPGALIPRPETEELVDWLLQENKATNLRVIDLCTGSGCIPIALAKERRNWEISALDLSGEALDIARENDRLNHTGIRFLQEDLLLPSGSVAGEEFDIIISNPPYVTEDQKKEMHPNVLAYEPHMALFAPGPDPLIFYRKIADFAATHLAAGGKIYLELNEVLSKETEAIFKQPGYKTELRKDIHGKFRMLCVLKHHS